MGNNGIAGIGKGAMPQITVADINEYQKEAAEVMFADMLSMGSKTNDFSMEALDDVAGSIQTEKIDVRKENAADAYEKYQYKDKTIRAESKNVSETDVDKTESEITEFTEGVSEVIQEELHISKEELEAAMEQLGLTYIDLLDISNLKNLVMKLTGSENLNQLLCSEAFTNIMKEVNAMGQELLSNLQMTKEEVMALQQNLQQMGENEVSAEVLGEEEPTAEIESNEQKVTESEEQNVVESEEQGTVELKNQNRIESNEQNTLKSEETEYFQNVEGSAKQESFSEQMNSSGEELSKEGQQNASNVFDKKILQMNEPQTNQEISYGAVQMNTIESQLGSVETVQSLPTYVSVTDIMEQFVEQTRVTLSAETTKMQMQLNPEHLGKLYLEVTESEGAVTAKIQTQNTIVKEALEMQIADLKQNLSQAGVRVDSVEVTVASHEFERNLEQDANSRKQQEEAQTKSARHRSLNLNSLDELSGLMTEEEALVAKMMAEQGNSVDYTA